jgi:hypothetical protein
VAKDRNGLTPTMERQLENLFRLGGPVSHKLLFAERRTMDALVRDGFATKDRKGLYSISDKGTRTIGVILGRR